mmetsp:Transcript_43935/g.95680  ORF Transcript_43935/g.95680 Transcript_43935/m.95680 type:complete len:219 (+) Transcript_43935:1631-2287(+)
MLSFSNPQSASDMVHLLACLEAGGVALASAIPGALSPALDKLPLFLLYVVNFPSAQHSEVGRHGANCRVQMPTSPAFKNLKAWQRSLPEHAAPHCLTLATFTTFSVLNTVQFFLPSTAEQDPCLATTEYSGSSTGASSCNKEGPASEAAKALWNAIAAAALVNLTSWFAAEMMAALPWSHATRAGTFPEVWASRAFFLHSVNFTIRAAASTSAFKILS